jgi:hypothetical protein
VIIADEVTDLVKKIHRQSKYWVNSPPITGPRTPAAAIVDPTMLPIY